jgi:5,10-methylenetetrahydromethanopterin reductase
MYRASVGLTTNMKASATGWVARNAGELGVDGIWIGEDIGRGQDTFVLAAAILLQSKGIRVGTGIVPIAVHNITTLARAAVTLQEIGEGRFVFGMGIGGIQDLQRINVKIKRPVTALKEGVDVLRRLWQAESITRNAEILQLQDYNLRLKKPIEIPVFLGVRGPQMLKLAGRIADGVILSGPFDYLRYAIEVIDKASSEAGRKRPILDMLQLNREKLERIQAEVAANGPKAAVPLIDQEIMDMFAISGNKEHMVDLFDQLGGMGATEVVLGPPFSGEWREAMSEIFEEIALRRGA